MKENKPQSKTRWPIYPVAALVLVVLIGVWLFIQQAAYKPVSRTIDLVIRNDKIQGNSQIKVRRGDHVLFRLDSDSRTEEAMHIEGYDLNGELEAGEPVELGFTADRLGVFKMMKAGTDIQLGTLTVSR